MGQVSARTRRIPSLDLVGRPAVDLLRTSSALCR
ncbi:putative leader peptide [Blastococcus sp. TML/C7B]